MKVDRHIHTSIRFELSEQLYDQLGCQGSYKDLTSINKLFFRLRDQLRNELTRRFLADVRLEDGLKRTNSP